MNYDIGLILINIVYPTPQQVIMKLNAVKVLNLLGNMDYRVIGTSSPDKKQLICTLEHKDFKKLEDLQNEYINHSNH